MLESIMAFLGLLASFFFLRIMLGAMGGPLSEAEKKKRAEKLEKDRIETEYCRMVSDDKTLDQHVPIHLTEYHYREMKKYPKQFWFQIAPPRRYFLDLDL